MPKNKRSIPRWKSGRQDSQDGVASPTRCAQQYRAPMARRKVSHRRQSAQSSDPPIPQIAPRASISPIHRLPPGAKQFAGASCRALPPQSSVSLPPRAPQPQRTIEFRRSPAARQSNQPAAPAPHSNKPHAPEFRRRAAPRIARVSNAAPPIPRIPDALRNSRSPGQPRRMKRILKKNRRVKFLPRSKLAAKIRRVVEHQQSICKTLPLINRRNPALRKNRNFGLGPARPHRPQSRNAQNRIAHPIRAPAPRSSQRNPRPPSRQNFLRRSPKCIGVLHLDRNTRIKNRQRPPPGRSKIKKILLRAKQRIGASAFRIALNPLAVALE